MNPTALRQKLIDVLCQIQIDSGLECPTLTGATKPVGSIPKFDSKVWPVATTILAIEIGASIPDDVNIFIDDATKQPRSVDEIAAFVYELLAKHSKEQPRAA